MKEINSKLEYELGKVKPVYEGRLEIVHEDCTFVKTAEHTESSLEITVLCQKEKYENRRYEWTRFFVDKVLNKSEIENILSPLFRSRIIRRAKVWANGGTVFTMLVNDLTLNSLQHIIDDPQGYIKNYEASQEGEFATIFSPSLGDKSGKEVLLEIEEELKLVAKEAELVSYKRLTEEDTRKTFISSPEFSSQWLVPEEERILSVAITQGYFETPKRINIQELSEILGMSSSTLNSKLRLINRQVLDSFIKKASIHM